MTVSARVTEDPTVVISAFAAGDERTVSEDAATQLLADPAARAVIGFVDDTPVGYAIAYLVTRVDGIPMLILYDVTVSPAHRRRGVATAMIESVLAMARESGASKVWTITDADDPVARAVYRSTGATGDGGDVVMVWRMD